MLSRSRRTKRSESARRPKSPARLRACWVAHCAVGCAVTPVMWSLRVQCSRNASAYNRFPVIVSTWKKSAAMIPSTWAVRNSRQLGPVRRGAGSTPAACKISQTVDGAIRCPSRANSPLDSAVAPPWVLPRQPQHQLLQRGHRRWTPSASTSSDVVPLRSDKSAVPTQQRPWGDQEDTAPAEQRRQRGQPKPVCWLITDRTVNLSPQHRVLMSENEQLGVLAGVPAQQYRRHGQQRTSCSVQQRNDHPGSISATAEELRT